MHFRYSLRVLRLSDCYARNRLSDSSDGKFELCSLYSAFQIDVCYFPYLFPDLYAQKIAPSSDLFCDCCGLSPCGAATFAVKRMVLKVIMPFYFIYNFYFRK